MKYKKADARLLSFYWILIFILIAIAIVSATALFFGSPLDIRQVESRILSDRVIKCVVESGSLNENFNLLQQGNLIADVCKFNFDDGKYGGNQFYINLSVENKKDVEYKEDNSGRLVSACEVNSRKLPICHKEILFVLDNNNLVVMEVLTSVRKIEQNA